MDDSTVKTGHGPFGQPHESFRSFWGADSPVFSRNASPAGLFFPAPYRPGLERVLHFCGSRHGLVCITGEAGCGKSSLARWLYDQLDPSAYEILLTSLIKKQTQPGWLAPKLATFLGASDSFGAEGYERALERLGPRLDEICAAGRKILVLVDSAHFATGPEAFEEIGALMNLQSLAGSFISFVLLGSPALANSIRGSEELATKVSFWWNLPPVPEEELADYINHKLAAAGAKARFEDSALQEIYRLTGGVFGRIDQLCELCLVEAFHGNRRNIDAATVFAAAAVVDPAGETARTPHPGPEERTHDPRDAVDGSPERNAPPPHATSPAQRTETPHASEAAEAGGAPTTSSKAPVSPKDPGPDEDSPESAASDRTLIKLSSLFKSNGPDGKKPS